MEKQNRASKSRKIIKQNKPDMRSPHEVLNTSDPGDDTQRRFRYQHAYGVILLIASALRKRPYTAIWCEHHEDLLGQISNDHFDGYQIKTRQPEDGLWTLSDDALKKSIERFIELDRRFPGKIKEFFFISNVGYEDSNAQNKIKRSPMKLVKAVEHLTSISGLTSPTSVAFEELRLHCNCESLTLLAVLQKLSLVKGPGLDSFDAEIAQDHLPALSLCKNLPAVALAALRDDLIAQVYKASSLSVNDPSRHWYALNEDNGANPTLQAKKVTVVSIQKFIKKQYPYPFNQTEDLLKLGRRLQETLNLYLACSFREDQVAKLDQAGETDAERMTLLHQVFVDLELKPRIDQPYPPHHSRQGQLPLFADSNPELGVLSKSRENTLSAMECFTKEIASYIVIIGGPGHGKSTLGQYLAQIHRAILLNRQEELYRDIPGSKVQKNTFRPKTKRIPFRIVLKYFAQWLADGPVLKTVEAYIAEQIAKGGSRPNSVKALDVQNMLKLLPVLVIFDGLDEVNGQVLCAQMLSCIDDFLARAEQLGANIQVIATSRPTSYKDQFTPRSFWHLELQPMSIEKVQEYSVNWVTVKVPPEEERRRIKETLEDCLKESHTRSLLTTPLQVTIILLIIKDGGRPPSQREELFHQYWTTILRREKSKAKGMIHTTDDGLLFNLHAYMGYLLHNKSTAENARSLFPLKEFEKRVHTFLISKDHISPPEVIQLHVTQMVEDARTRLVLLVEPETGFIGFELRSLQEFFAGVYLVQTSCDTKQRFERLKAITYIEHWRNVALFFAGHIVREYSGESANILELVCRSIDRDPSDIYLRRGAWFALDIATDGVFSSNRDFQSSALEHALTVLGTGITTSGQQRLETVLQRLSLEDRRDILSKLLKQKLTVLPLSCLPTALNIYGKFIIDTQLDFIQALDVLLSSNKQACVLEALNLGFKYEVNLNWLAIQLDKYWDFWIVKKQHPYLWRWWYTNPQYTQKVLSTLIVSENRVNDLMDCLLSSGLISAPTKISQISTMQNPSTFSEQIILLLQCLSIIANNRFEYRHIYAHMTIISTSLRIHVPNMKNPDRPIDTLIKAQLFPVMDQLIVRQDLLPQLKICLWALYWHFYEPADTMVTIFLNEGCAWLGKQALVTFLRLIFRYYWSSIELLLEGQLKNDQNTIALLRSSLNISINQQVTKALQQGLKQLSHEEQLATVLSYHYGTHNFLELASTAEKLGINVRELINVHTVWTIETETKLSSTTLQYLFSYIEETLVQSEKPQFLSWAFLRFEWDLNYETAQQGGRLLHALVGKLSQYPDILQDTITFLFHLLSFDPNLLSLAPTIISYITDETLENKFMFGREWANTLFGIPSELITNLANFTKHKDEKIQQGAIILWGRLIEIVLVGESYPKEVHSPLIETLNFDWELALSLIKYIDSFNRKKGIMLLICSHFPINEAIYSEELLSTIEQSQDIDEIQNWVLFLKNVPMRKPEITNWQQLLETILAHPQKYTSHVLTAAMERYTTLDVGIRNESVLDL